MGDFLIGLVKILLDIAIAVLSIPLGIAIALLVIGVVFTIAVIGLLALPVYALYILNEYLNEL